MSSPTPSWLGRNGVEARSFSSLRLRSPKQPGLEDWHTPRSGSSRRVTPLGRLTSGSALRPPTTSAGPSHQIAPNKQRWSACGTVDRDEGRAVSTPPTEDAERLARERAFH